MKKSIQLLAFLFVSSFSFGQCNFTLEAFDTFDNSWNAGSLDIKLDGVAITGSPYTFVGINPILTFPVNNTQNLILTWTAGSFNSEIGYKLKDNSGAIIFETGTLDGNVTSGPDSGVNFNNNIFCVTTHIASIERTNNDIFCGASFHTYKVIATHPNNVVPILVITSGIQSQEEYLDIFVNEIITYGVNNDTTSFLLNINTISTLPNPYQTDTFEIRLTPNVGGVTLDSVTINCKVYDLIFPTLTNASLTKCSNDFPFDAFVEIQPTDASGEFSWANETGSMISPVDLFSFIGGGSMGEINYKLTNSDGCSGSTNVIVNFNELAIITTNTTGSLCGQATGSANVTLPIGVIGNVYWSTGLSETSIQTSSVSVLSSGTYYANITDQNGCTIVKPLHISDSDITVTEVITPQTCQTSNNGEINLTVTPPTGAAFTSFWSNGVTTEDMLNSPTGEYSVEIHTDNNCNFFGTYLIPDNTFKFEIAAGYPLSTACTGTASGAANVIITGGSGNYGFDWYNKTTSTAFSTMQNLSGATAGIYECTVTDTDNNCSKSWGITIPAATDAIVNVTSITKEDCGQSNGSINIDEQIFGNPLIASWLWSNGETTKDLDNVSAGDYSLAFTDFNGCTSYLEVTVPNVKPYQPQICLLTVDTSNTYNMIVWEKDGTPIVDGWNLYRETTVYGDFELVATIPYEDDAVFIDNAASPMSRSWRYYITSFNSCGESYGSFIHKTIHIVTANDNAGTGMDVFWDDYEGISYSSLNLLKYTDVTGWITIPVTGNSYNDTPQAVDPSLTYMLEFNLASPCNPGKAIDHNSSRSNKSSGIFHAGGETGLTIIENEDGKIMMYPNPTQTDLTIYIENSDKFKYFKIVDINGKLIYQQTISTDYNLITTSDFAKGIYFVQIYSQNNVIIEKIIKQ